MTIKMISDYKFYDQKESIREMKKFTKERHAFIQQILIEKSVKKLEYDFINHCFCDYEINYEFNGWLARSGVKRPERKG